MKNWHKKDTKKRVLFISDHKNSYLEIVSIDWRPQLQIVFIKEKGKERKKDIVDLENFINVKGVKAMGNLLTTKSVKEMNLLDPLPYAEVLEINEEVDTEITTRDDNQQGQIKLEL